MIGSPVELQSLLQSWSATGDGGSSPLASRRVRLGHLTVQFDFNDDRLAALYWRALKHVAGTLMGESDVHIHVLCGDAMGMQLPRMGWTPSDFGLKRTVPGWSDETRTTFLLRTERGIALYDHSERVAFVWVPSLASLPWWERAAPARWLLDIIAQHNALCTVHAACVGRGDAAVLIAGPGGSGKSSLALACAGRGLDYLADDYCLLALGEEARCHSIYCSGKWQADSQVLPEILNAVPAHASDRTGDKAMVFVDEAEPLSVARQGKLKALILPRQVPGSTPAMSRAEPGQAVKFIMPSTVAQSEAPASHVLRSVAALARRVPAFHFDMPADPDLCAAHVADLIASLSNHE